MKLLEALRHFDRHPLLAFGPSEQAEIDQLVQSFMFFFAHPDYVIPTRRRPQFIQLNICISNLVANSSFKTTDAWLPSINAQSDNLAKLLACYSCRNTTRIPARKFFDVSPKAASLWFFSFMHAYQGALSDESCYEHLRYHLQSPDERLTATDISHHAFFGATYVDAKLDRPLKTLINRSVQKLFADSGIVVKNRPNPRKIGVVTATWYTTHSVYRNHFDMVAALKDDYELVLINTATKDKPIDTSLFSQVIEMRRNATGISLEPLLENDFGMIYYPDIGMTTESLFLANARLAPLQVTSYGHSVSTFGADIDYYLASEDVEDLSRLAENYSERVVLLPGLGVTNTRPAHRPSIAPAPSGPVIVNCSWFPQKIGVPLLDAMERIVAACPPDRARFRFFSSHALLQAGHYLPFVRAVRRRLNKSIELLRPLPFERYLDEMARGHFALEPFPFGGCNTIADSLHLRQPILCFEGARWYSRIGSAILRKAGLEELVAREVDSYVDKAVRLILEPGYLERMRQEIAALDLDSLLYAKDYARSFKQAVDFLMANHSRLKGDGSREPLRLSDLTRHL